MKTAILSLGVMTLLAGCTQVTPYPNYNPIHGAEVSANRQPRGTRDFCRKYAQQTAGNAYENRIDRGEDSLGAGLITRQRAEEEGRRAYRRCLAGRTG